MGKIIEYWIIDENFFIIDSNNLENVIPHMYGFSVGKNGIFTDNYYKKLGKYTPIFNFYKNINNSEFDTKYLFFTNNTAENINKLLNYNFSKNYPSFLEWKNAILKLHENFEKNNSELLRRNFFSNSLVKIYLCSLKMILKI